MIIAERQSFVAPGGKNPYVTDGLVAWWDGFWNAGFGRHDPNATVWVDLAGNRVGTISTAANGWNTDSLRTKKSTSVVAAVTFDRFQFSEIGTLEMVYRVDSCQNPNGETFLFIGGGNRVALSFVNGGTVSECLIITTPDRRISLSGSVNTGIAQLAVRHQTSIVFGSRTTLDGWSIRQDGKTVTPSNPYVGNVTVQTNSVGTLFGRTVSAANNALGEICCVRIYSRALTAAEIAHNHDVDVRRFVLPS